MPCRLSRSDFTFIHALIDHVKSYNICRFNIIISSFCTLWYKRSIIIKLFVLYCIVLYCNLAEKKKKKETNPKWDKGLA